MTAELHGIDMMAARKVQQWPKESIGLLGAVLDCLPQSVAVLEQSGRIVAVNQAWINLARQHGAAPDAEWIGADYLAACRDGEWKWLEGAGGACHAIREVLAGTRNATEAVYRFNGNGEQRWFRLRTTGFDCAGRRLAVVVHGNINENGFTAESVTRSELQYRNLVENALTGVASVTLDGRIIFANAAAARMFEFDSPEQMQAEGSLARWRDPQDRESFISELRHRGYVDNYEMDGVTRTGRTIRALFSATLHNDEMSVTMMDITALRQSEAVVAESEKRFRATFEQAAVGLAHVAPDGRFLRINRKFCDIVGYSQEEMLERRFQDITHPDDLNADLEQVRQLLEGRESTYSMDKRYFCRDGRIVWINLTVSLVRDEAGNPDYLVAVVEDITERKTAEMRLRENQARLRALASELTRAEERQRRDLATELHDHVAQSLTFMGMQLTAARKQSAGRQVAATLDQVSESLRQVIQDTRNIMSDLSAPARTEPSFPAVLSERLMAQISERYGLETELIDDGEAKPLGMDARAVLFRSVRELLLNVVKHAAATRATVSLQRKDGAVEIVVQDNGRGLPGGRIPDQEPCAGGFGLYSIRERMRDLGGSLKMESRPGEGVKAILTVPLEVE
jgi:two-component system sensor histidine kinase UhpB